MFVLDTVKNSDCVPKSAFTSYRKDFKVVSVGVVLHLQMLQGKVFLNINVFVKSQTGARFKKLDLA